MLSHIRTQKTRRALPCGLFEGHTDFALLGNELSVSVCGFPVLRARFPGALAPLFPLLLGCVSTIRFLGPAPEPLLVGATFRLNYF